MRIKWNTPLYDNRRFRLMMLWVWLYTLAWCAALGCVAFVVRPWYYKAFGIMLIAMTAPSIEDLFITYERYRHEWEESNRTVENERGQRDSSYTEKPPTT
jgi:hypothetical protein